MQDIAHAHRAAPEPPLSAELARVESLLDELLYSPISEIPPASRVGGDRLHARVTLLAAQAAGYRDDHRLTVAAAGELLHLARLLHRDVSDPGAFGRGRPAPRIGLGDGLAVLTGDCYLARGLLCVAGIGHGPVIRSMVDVIERTYEGEVAELARAGALDLDRGSALRIVEQRSAGLLGWCGAVGHLLAPDLAGSLGAYGRALGLALQVVDDLRDCTPGAGRPGQELRDGKVTLPVVLGCARSARLRDAVAALLRGPAPVDEPRLAEVLELVAESGGLDEARAIAASHFASARAALAALPPSPARIALAELARGPSA
jgi:octaprenyl-diphosphate synthase